MGPSSRKTDGRGRGLRVQASFSWLPFMKHLPCARYWAEDSGAFLSEPAAQSGRWHPFYPQCTDEETEAESWQSDLQLKGETDLP